MQSHFPRHFVLLLDNPLHTFFLPKHPTAPLAISPINDGADIKTKTKVNKEATKSTLILYSQVNKMNIRMRGKREKIITGMKK
jgi:hypothetical protein